MQHVLNALDYCAPHIVMYFGNAGYKIKLRNSFAWLSEKNNIFRDLKSGSLKDMRSVFVLHVAGYCFE